MHPEIPWRAPIMGYARLKSVMYSAEGLLGPLIEVLINRRRPRLLTDNPALFRASREALESLLQRDVANIASGVYPLEVLRPENPVRHLLRIPEMLREGIEIARRRNQKNAHEFGQVAEDLLSELPEYYRRNFHFQGNGYLSERSARLYDHQVEVLFAGAGDAMRRLILAPLRQHFGSSDGKGLSFLELGAGTGSATRFVRMAFPKARIVAVDLSGAYLHVAQERLKRYSRHDFIEGNAEELPFQKDMFDAAYSVFLFHELPMEARERVVDESLRVLKPGGFFGLVDSLQKGDVPALDVALEQFPKDFHEPFYKNYIQHPLEALLKDRGMKSVASDFGFFSKVVTGTRPLRGSATKTH